MSKRVQLTEALKAKIRLAIDNPSAPVDQFYVFEARFLSTEPLSKGGLLRGARVSASTLREMEAQINTPGGALPLHIMHEDQFLPVGKVFSASVRELPTGETEIRGQFYLPDTELELINKIETSVVDEVSVGIRTNHAFCSECEFDYLGEDATFVNIIDLTCNNGHTIGINGVHARLVGLKGWDELSLVGTGAANKAKILPNSKHSMSKHSLHKFNTSEKSIGYLVLSASNKIDDNPEDIVKTTKGVKAMPTEFEALLSKYEGQVSESKDMQVKLAAAEDQIKSLEAEVVKLSADCDDKATKLAAIEATKTEDQKVLEQKIQEESAKVTAAFDALMPHVKAALTASGVSEEDMPKDLVTMAQTIVDRGLKLHQLMGSEGASSGTKNDVSLSSDELRRIEAFKLTNKSKE